jgi:hypothetical protein
MLDYHWSPTYWPVMFQVHLSDGLTSVNVSMQFIFRTSSISLHALHSHLWYNCHNSGHYPSSCLLFTTQLNSIGLSVPHMKHITSPLRAQQANAIYRFVTMIYQYNYYNSGHYQSSCLLFKTQSLGDWILSPSPVREMCYGETGID